VAEAGERSAQRATISLLGELGRSELLAGNPDRAAALLGDAYVNGDTSVATRFLLGTAMRNVESVRHTLVGNSLPVGFGQLAFSSDGNRLIAVHGTVAEQWTVDGRRLPSLTDRGAVLGMVSYSADGQSVVTYDRDFVRIWNAASGRLVQKVEVQGVRVAMLARDGSEFLTLDDDGIAKRWDTESGGMREERRVGVRGREWDSDADSGRLIGAKQSGPLALWDWERDHEPTETGGWRPASRREVSGDGTRYVGCFDLTTTIWDRTGAVVRTLHASRPTVSCSIDDAATRVVTMDVVGKATVWDVASGEVLSEIAGSYGQLSGTFAGSWLITVGLGISTNGSMST
jgi:WD40 repeat protein